MRKSPPAHLRARLVAVATAPVLTVAGLAIWLPAHAETANQQVSGTGSSQTQATSGVVTAAARSAARLAPTPAPARPYVTPAPPSGTTSPPVTRADWPAPTVTVSTEAQLVTAIAAAKPGTVIGLQAGTYSGLLNIKTSGTAAAPITIRPVGTAAVTITASLAMPSCGATGPDPNRTIKFQTGASYWSLLGLNIRGGVMISSQNSQYAQNWLSAKVKSGDWQSRRAVPGRSTNDPVADRSALSYVSKTIGKTVIPSDGLVFSGNTFTLKGVHARAARYGTFSDNTIKDIACGTGPGLWLAMFSDGWTVSGNDVSAIAHSTAGHWMQEGIRLGGSAAYNTVSNNTVHDLATGGRAFTTDQDSSFNVFSHNTANNVYIGFNDEMAGWGNVWEYNVATNFDKAGFSLRMMDGKFATPSKNSSTNMVVVRCNQAVGTGDFQAGAMMAGTIKSNSFNDVFLSKNLRSYFAAQGNTWNGSGTPPSTTPTASLAGC